MGSKIKPILSWPGGKTQKTIQFSKFLPLNFRSKFYVEPCVGSGAFLFAFHPRKAIINDINVQLMNFYEIVRDIPMQLVLQIQDHMKNDTEQHFYEVRDLYNLHVNESCQSVEMAGYFLFLNCRCYNGLYRVNKEGKFNVGWYHESRQRHRFETINKVIFKISEYLKTIEIHCGSYDLIPPDIPNAFYLIDPPYVEGFTQYDTCIWDKKQFELLRDYVDQISNAKNQVLVCNLDTPFIRELFEGFELKTHKVPRFISCDGNNRKPVSEIVITNYQGFRPLFS